MVMHPVYHWERKDNKICDMHTLPISFNRTDLNI